MANEKSATESVQPMIMPLSSCCHVKVSDPEMTQPEIAAVVQDYVALAHGVFSMLFQKACVEWIHRFWLGQSRVLQDLICFPLPSESALRCALGI